MSRLTPSTPASASPLAAPLSPHHRTLLVGPSSQSLCLKGKHETFLDLLIM